MSADPPRRRRSSFSEHFQRVFHGDRADRTDRSNQKRQSLGQDTPTLSRSARPSDDYNAPKSETAAPSADETGISSFNFSSNSHIPSLSTAGSSASVHAILKDGDTTPPEPTEPKRAVERGRVFSAPTWGKETSRKERRATKRLEAERKELEKRMLQLDQSQAQQDSGADRNTRRLVKKQTGSADRSSSAGSLRLRSSSITSFFTGRRSRSRAGSTTGSDNESTRDSTDTNAAEPIPPSIPLALQERFGADVSRELANRHGTTLIPASQLATQLPSQPPQLQRLHHTPLKSDDLRENWKMAEEWKKTQGSGPHADVVQAEHMTGEQSQKPRLSIYGTNLDQEFTVTPNYSRKTPKGSPSPGNATRQVLSLRNTPERSPQVQDPSNIQITNMRQLRDFSNTKSETPTLDTDIQPMHAEVSNYPNQVESSHTHPRAYISSPLAMNPNTPDSPTQSPNNPSLGMDELDLPQPLRISKSPQFEEPRRHDRQSSFSPSERAQSRPKAYSSGKVRQPEEFMHSRAIAPPKNPNRRSLEDQILKPTSKESPGGHTTLNDASNSSKDPRARYHLASHLAEEEQPPVSLNDTENKRLSQSSVASSYNTADEEVLDVPPRWSNRASIPASEPNEKRSPIPTIEITTPRDPPKGLTNPRTRPPLTAAALSMLRKTPMQKIKPPRSDDVLTKLFVICCQCKHWHDMPSDIYAKLGSPGRPSESRLSRTFSRRNSARNSIFSSEPDDPRRMPVSGRVPPNGQAQVPSGDGVPQPQPPVHRYQCCWCSHGMSKTCCQGWTALVQMRERCH
ncbi:hypothetical protein N7520_001842 [Penicillium odoratum]|uniref:uncharacterized protein n=1 Tax=Penicillium odoratum TaxID=1167516 RepID=UPI0025467F56|nr:uncharacterized protein N7520_001842 [Penicillium odoratum]KAJ5778596.1 hypothetical protein N7520_001842 [Penicillium odoratum]